MFAGHIGAALAIGRTERRVNLGVFVFAAMLLDFLLWIFILLGWESVAIPADFATSHQPEFEFPWTHGLVAAILWSLLAGAVLLSWPGHGRTLRRRAALCVAAAVFSHWLLDALVHRPELPLAGPGSTEVGLALWDRMPLALTVEGIIALVGLLSFLWASGLSRARVVLLCVWLLVILLATIAGMTVAPPPPSATAMALSSLATIVIVTALAAAIARRPGRSKP